MAGGIKKHSPGCNCCEGTCYGRCSSDPTALDMEVVISGVIDDVCDDCDNVNGTYICTRVGEIGCSYTLLSAGTMCAGTFYVAVEINDLGIQVHAGWSPIFNKKVFFRKDDEVIDCANMTDLDIPFVSDGGCDGSSATCLLSAI